jgi:hypothetical protein
MRTSPPISSTAFTRGGSSSNCVLRATAGRRRTLLADWPETLRGPETSSLEMAEGESEAHAYVLYFEAGGEIGPHEGGYGQLFLALWGEGCVAGPRRRPSDARYRRGCIHLSRRD